MLREEKVKKRWSYVFETHRERRGGGYPSEDRREKIEMSPADDRTYSQLPRDTQPESRMQMTMQCHKTDTKDSHERVGQQGAFRRFFYELVIKKSFRPIVCMD